MEVPSLIIIWLNPKIPAKDNKTQNIQQHLSNIYCIKKPNINIFDKGIFLVENESILLCEGWELDIEFCFFNMN